MQYHLNLPKIILFMRLGSILFLLLSIFQTNSSQAQILADFKADTLKGCAPLTINFTDQSSGNITSRKWNFGNGNLNFGNEIKVVATYPTAGTYTVILTVEDGFSSGSVSKTIKVFNNPVAD